MPENQHTTNNKPVSTELFVPNDSSELNDYIKRAVELAANDETDFLFSVTIAYEQLDPLAVLEVLAEPQTFQYYWEYPEEKLAISAGKSIVQLKANGSDRFESVSKSIQAWKDKLVEYSIFNHSLAGLHFLGGFSFFNHVSSEKWAEFDSSTFIVPEWTFIKDGELSILTLNKRVHPFSDPDELTQSILNQFSFISQKLKALTNSSNQLVKNSDIQKRITIIEDESALKDWRLNIQKAKEHIHLGKYDKIVLSREIGAEIDGEYHPTRILNALRREYPACYTFLFRPEGKSSFIGCTPERLLSIRSNYILTEGLAGSISRGKTATEDTILEKKLINSEKDLEEHRYVLKSIEIRLHDFSDEINYPKKPGIKKFTNVQHLYTPVSAWMRQSYDAFAILKRMHPTPAVGGFPTVNALPDIPVLELYDRGWYAGPVGWINSKGRGEFVVAIRSGLVNENKASFYAGCGIVEHSDPDSEWEETKLKFIPMLDAIRHA